MEMLIIIILYIFIIIFDFRRIIKSKSQKEIWLYSIALTASFVVLILNSLNIHIPFDIY